MEGCLGEESAQMWGLNRRLEAYLARVKALEEHNELLSAELVGLRAQSGDASWRARADDELAALRALVDQRWREKHAAEVARDNLEEEVQSVAARCQQQRLARERTAAEVARSRRAVEEERGARAWLSGRAAELERELEAVRAAHEEERAGLSAPAAGAPCRPGPPRGAPAPGPEVQELALRFGEAWRGAVRGYQERVARMEAALGQARQRLGLLVQGAREGRRQLQQLQAERGGLQERRAALEQRLEGRWQERLRATEKFQRAVEALEHEKQGLQGQIAQVLEGRQQLAHLKMSLSLEVATYRTLLEAENSRLQTPCGGSKASFSFQDPKLELPFPGTPKGWRLRPLLSALSPTPLSSPLPEALEIPVPTFLQSQELLQARPPTLASTPIPPTPQAPCSAPDEGIRAKDILLSVLQPQAMWAEARVAVPILQGPEEPGGKQQEASTDQSPEGAPPLSPDHRSSEAKDGEASESRVCSGVREEGEGRVWEPAEKEAAVEVKVVSGLQQETQREEGVQEAQVLLRKETLTSLEEKVQEPLVSLGKKSCEVQRSPEEENQDSLRSLEEGNLETLPSLEKENQERVKSLEEKDTEVVGALEKETPQLLKPVGTEDSETSPSLEKENQELLSSLEDNLETFLYPGKENQELVGSLEEENFESLRVLEKQNQEPLRSLEEDQEIMEPIERENQEPPRSLEKDQEIMEPLEKQTQAPLKSLEENQEIMEPLEKQSQAPLRSLEEDQEIMETLERENQEPLGSLEENQEITEPLEKQNQAPLRSLEENQEIIELLEKQNEAPLRSLEENQEIMEPLEKQNQAPLRSLEEENQEIMETLERENQEPLRSLEENQEIMELLEKQNEAPLRSLEENQEIMEPLEKQNEAPLRSLEENQEIMEPLEKQNEAPLRSLEENQEIMEPLEKQNEAPLRSLEENQEIMEPLEKQNEAPLRSLEENQEIMEPLEKQNQAPLRSLEEENQEIMEPPERKNQEPLRSLEDEHQEVFGHLEKENQELLRSLKGESVEAVRCLEAENVEPLKSAAGPELEVLKPTEAQAPLRSLEEMARKMVTPLGKEMREENRESLRPLEQETPDSLGSLREWNPENWRSPEEVDQGSPRYPAEEASLGAGGRQERLRALEEEEWALSARQQRWEDALRGNGERGQEAPPGRAVVDTGDEAELDWRAQDGSAGQEGAPQLPSTAGARGAGEGHPGSPGPEEQRVPAEGASGERGAGGPQDPAGQPEQGAPPGLPASRRTSEVIEPVSEGEEEAPGADRMSPEVTLGWEMAVGEAAAGAQRGPEQEDPGQLGREEVTEPPQGEQGLEPERVQGLEGPGEDLEVAAVGPELSLLPRGPLQPSRAGRVGEPEAPRGGDGVLPVETLTVGQDRRATSLPTPLGSEAAEEGAEPVLGPPSPKPTEPSSATPVPEDAPGPQPLAEGSQDTRWGLEGGAEAPGRVGSEQEEVGSGGLPEGLQDEDGEESREESEADGLGETLPDSTPLGLYLRSPAGEQRPSPLGDPGEEGWGLAVLPSGGWGPHPEAEEEDRGQDSDLLEEFEDLGTEASLLPGDPGDGRGPPGQAPQLLLEPATWGQDGESDGFADEESGEEEEEGRGPGAGHWGPGPSVVGSPPAPGGPQRAGDLLGSETGGVSIPWDESLRGAAARPPGTAPEPGSQDSTEPSGSEEEFAGPLERGDPAPGPTETLSGTEDTPGVNGQGPSLKDELEHVNGGMVGWDRAGQGKLGALGGARGSPSEEEDGGSPKSPWARAPLHLGPSQFLQFTQREGDSDSWSSGED